VGGFLGLSAAEEALVDLRLTLSRSLKERRTRRRLSQEFGPSSPWEQPGRTSPWSSATDQGETTAQPPRGDFALFILGQDR